MKKLSFEEQTHLIDSFFNGKCFIEVNPNNSKDFLKFMSFYDSRWSDYEDLNITSTRYYAWRFSDALHHHQLEFDTSGNYWKGRHLEFSQVEDYINQDNSIKGLFINTNK